MEVRSNRFNYNKNYSGQRFYTFSTWTDDITQSFLTASNIVEAPSAFLAFKLPEGKVEELMNVLETYYENKLAHLRKNYISNKDIESNVFTDFNDNYSPLYYLFDALRYAKVVNDDTGFLLEDICEQNYNGTFTDILCTVPHGAVVKKISSRTSYPAAQNVQGTGATWFSHIQNFEGTETEYEKYDAVLENKVKISEIAWNRDSSDSNKRNIVNYYDSTAPTYVCDGTVGVAEYTVSFYYNDVKTVSELNTVTSKYILLYKSDSIVVASNNERNKITGIKLSVTEINGTERWKTSNQDAKVTVKISRKDTASTDIADIVTFQKSNTGENTVWEMSWNAETRDEYADEISVECITPQFAVDTISIISKKITVSTFSTYPIVQNDVLLGWSRDTDVIYDDYVNGAGKYLYKQEQAALYAQYPTEDIESDENLVSMNKEKVLDFVETSDETFEFNCIIPLYKRFDKSPEELADTAVNSLNLLKVKPLGIWINELDDKNEPCAVQVNTAASGNKYTASWSLSISAQIKPYYATNSIPVNYSSGTDMETAMQTFAGVLSKVQDLGQAVQTYQKQLITSKVESESSDLVSYMNLVRQMKRLRNEIKEYDSSIEQLREENTNQQQRVQSIIENTVVEKLTGSSASLTTYAKVAELTELSNRTDAQYTDLRNTIAGMGTGTLGEDSVMSVLYGQVGDSYQDILDEIIKVSSEEYTYTLSNDVQYLNWWKDKCGSDIEGHSLQINSLTRELSTVQSDIGSLEQEDTAIKKQIAQALTDADNKFSAISAKVKNNASAITDNQYNIENLQENVVTIIADIVQLRKGQITAEYLDEHINTSINSVLELQDYAKSSDVLDLSQKLNVVQQNLYTAQQDIKTTIVNVGALQQSINTTDSLANYNYTQNIRQDNEISTLRANYYELLKQILENITAEDGGTISDTVINDLNSRVADLNTELAQITNESKTARLDKLEDTVAIHEDKINQLMSGLDDDLNISLNATFEAVDVDPESYVTNPIGDITASKRAEDLKGMTLSRLLTQMLFPEVWTPCSPSNNGALKHTFNPSVIFAGIKDVYFVGIDDAPTVEALQEKVNSSVAAYNINTDKYKNGKTPVVEIETGAGTPDIDNGKYTSHSTAANIYISAKYEECSVYCTSNHLDTATGEAKQQKVNIAATTMGPQKKYFSVIYPTFVTASNISMLLIAATPGNAVTVTEGLANLISTPENPCCIYIPKMSGKSAAKITDICDIENYIIGWQNAGDTWKLVQNAAVPNYDSGSMGYWMLQHVPTGTSDVLTLRLTIKC